MTSNSMIFGIGLGLLAMAASARIAVSIVEMRARRKREAIRITHIRACKNKAQVDRLVKMAVVCNFAKSSEYTLRTVMAPSTRLDEAMSSLSEVSKLSREFVDAFLNTLGDCSELVRIHVDNSTTVSTGEIRIALEPSDRLLGFLAAAGARNV